MTPIEQLRRRAEDLHLYGVLAHWHELADSVWLEPCLLGKKPSGQGAAWNGVWAAPILGVLSP